ncbi:mannosyl-glycoprotein endo-beta-N-acetylglucosaminidase, partial [Pelagirhabdus alkalitolerans]
MNKRYNLIISVLIIFILTSMHFSSDKVFAEEEFTIKPGDEHESVVDLKRDLEALGFGNFDNYSETYDDSLKSAVNSFHETFNIGDTEVVNEDTLAKIEALINSPFRNGERHEESIALKEQLTILGYTDFTNPNSFYG